MIWFLAYAACIVTANVAITLVGTVPVGFGLMAPAGVYFAGLAFSLRDRLQESAGRFVTVMAIILGAGVSALLSPGLALASGAAFLLSEAADMAVYSPLRERRLILAVVASNLVGLAIDSALFLWLAFGSLDFLAGQLVGKSLTIVPVVAWLWLRQAVRDAVPVAAVE